MTTGCVDIEAKVDGLIDKVSTQYRESPKLLHLVKTYLRQVGEVMDAVCSVPSFFDIDTAVGDQLTLIGGRLGWVRCHCICNTQPVFGFDCTGVPSSYVIAGFCDQAITWVDCGPFGSSDLCITDDDIYRRFLKVRRYQVLALYDLQSLTEAVKILWGDAASVMDARGGRVIVAPGRALTVVENALMPLYLRVLPIAPGIEMRVHYGSQRVFGFGEGWGGFCDTMLPSEPITAMSGDPLLADTGEPILATALPIDAPWMCQIDVKPYSC